MPEHENLTAALLALQAELPKVGKDKTADVLMKAGGKYTYKYADLGTVQDALFPLLEKHGLVWVTNPTVNDRGFVLHYEMRHGPDSIVGDYPLQQGGPQDIGSAITYARRYALCAVTGLAPGGDDDDGAKAQKAKAAPRTFSPEDDAAVTEWLEEVRAAPTTPALEAVWGKIGNAGFGGDRTLIQATNAAKRALAGRGV